MANSWSCWRALACLGLTTTLTCCQQGATVEVIQTGGQIIFDVKRGDASKPACVFHIEVAPTASGGGKPIWESGDGGNGPCVGRFVFGRVAPGFTSSGPAPILVEGGTYRVDVSGIGFSGGAQFTVGAKSG